MPQYRFVTPNRIGKWYDRLAQAQQQANAIGAGFLDGSGNFVPYRGCVLELREKPLARQVIAAEVGREGGEAAR